MQSITPVDLGCQATALSTYLADLQATDVVHDVEGAGKGKGGLSTAEKDLESGAKGKSGVSGVESDIAKGKGDIKKAEDMHKAEGMAK